MENNQRNSRKRLNSLILLVAFTAVMLIVSTYAWFSTQKNVTLSGLYGKVNVAEGLQISLDGSVWVNSIDFADFDQTTTSWTLKSGVDQTTYFDANTTSPSFQYPAGTGGEITNVIPTEYLPASTTGYGGDGIGTTLLKMYEGNVENNKKLTGIRDLPEESASGYFAFDVFLQNSSAEGVTTDTLQLDKSSSVSSDNTGTGIENTVRVGFALYNNTGANISTSAPRSQSDVLTGTSTEKTIKDVAIWEPNANQHTATIVNTNNALTLGADRGDVPTGNNKFTAIHKLPTYALTAASKSATYTVGEAPNQTTITGIADIYDWSTTGITASKLAKQYTLQTPALSTDWAADSIDLVSVGKSSGEIADAEDTTFEIAASQYHKIRIYVWIEGQDPDCINAASLGGGLTLDIGFSKPGSENPS